MKEGLSLASLESSAADQGRPAFLLRFGYAPPPSGQTGRLPLSAVTKTAVALRTEAVVAG